MSPSTRTFNLATASADQILSLPNIRAVLQRLEDTIVFQLIERAQFAHNAPMYQPGAIQELVEGQGWKASWVEWFLKEVESAHARCRRWSAPDEYPFTPLELLPKAVLPPIQYPNLLYNHGINVNRRIYEYYRDRIVPSITVKFNETSQGAPADDGQYGSAAVRDAEVLWALSRRIHFGMFVSESKFRSEPKEFLEPIRRRDEAKLLALITKPAVEAALLVRLREKASVYGQDLDQAVALSSSEVGGSVVGVEKKQEERDTQRKIEAEVVVQIYETFVIPLTKDVEVDYLLKRLDHLSPSQLEAIEAGKGFIEE